MMNEESTALVCIILAFLAINAIVASYFVLNRLVKGLLEKVAAFACVAIVLVICFSIFSKWGLMYRLKFCLFLLDVVIYLIDKARPGRYFITNDIKDLKGEIKYQLDCMELDRMLDSGKF